MTQLEEVIDDRLAGLFANSETFRKRLSYSLVWHNLHVTFLKYWKIGYPAGRTAHIYYIRTAHLNEFEAVKITSPGLYSDFIDYLKYAYSHDMDEQQIRFQAFYVAMCLQQILVAKNSGFFDNYEKLLSDYYSVVYRDRKILNCFLKNLTGYGERPWRLFWLFFSVNLIFALIFTFSNMCFNFPNTIEPHGLKRFWDFYYFGNTTMLTVGYGDMYPLGPGAKLAVLILQLFGFSISGLTIALFLRRLLRF